MKGAGVSKARLSLLIFGLSLVSGCVERPVEGETHTGIAAINDLGCGACHVIPGVTWPKSDVGPGLDGFGGRNFIAGVLPNTPKNLAAFIQNAVFYVPEGAMPPIAMTRQQAVDISAYLHSLQSGAM